MIKLGTFFKRGPLASLLFSSFFHVLILVFVVGPYIDVSLEREEMVLELKEETGENKQGEGKLKEIINRTVLVFHDQVSL